MSFVIEFVAELVSGWISGRNSGRLKNRSENPVNEFPVGISGQDKENNGRQQHSR